MEGKIFKYMTTLIGAAAIYFNPFAGAVILVGYALYEFKIKQLQSDIEKTQNDNQVLLNEFKEIRKDSLQQMTQLQEITERLIPAVEQANNISLRQAKFTELFTSTQANQSYAMSRQMGDPRL